MNDRIHAFNRTNNRILITNVGEDFSVGGGLGDAGRHEVQVHDLPTAFQHRRYGMLPDES